MFNVGFGELLVILIIGFVVVGPRGLPELARSAARLWREVRRYADQLAEEVRSNMGELEKELGDLPQEIRSTASALDGMSDRIARKIEGRNAGDGAAAGSIGGPPPEPSRPPASSEVVADPDLETFVTGDQGSAGPKKDGPA